MIAAYDEATVERLLDEREQQTGSRYCDDPMMLAPIADILRQAAEQAPEKKKSARVMDAARPRALGGDEGGHLTDAAPNTA